MPDLTSALDSVEAFAAGEDELDEAARSMDEHLDLVLDHVENGSGDHALTEAFIQGHVMQDPVQHNVTQHDVQVPSSQPGSKSLSAWFVEYIRSCIIEVILACSRGVVR